MEQSEREYTANLNNTANIVLNSRFNDTSSWVTEAGWAITSGNAVATAATSNIYQINLPVTNRSVYACSYQITARTSGNVRLRLTAGDYSNTTSPVQSAVGTYKVYFFINSSNVVTTANIYVLGNAFTGNVDNITANLVGNWNINDPALQGNIF